MGLHERPRPSQGARGRRTGNRGGARDVSAAYGLYVAAIARHEEAIGSSEHLTCRPAHERSLELLREAAFAEECRALAEAAIGDAEKLLRARAQAESGAATAGRGEG